MDEKIKELARKAGLEDQVTPFDEFDNLELQAFAELIIEECIVLAKRERIRNGSDTEHNQAVSKVIESIKEHFGTAKGEVMTPEFKKQIYQDRLAEVKKQFYQDRLTEIRRGGNTSHSVFVTDYIGGYGANLGPVDPPVVGLVGDDHYYAQYFQNWYEVDKFIEELRAEATKAWGSQYHQYHQYPEDRMTIDPVTGDVGIGTVKFDTSGDLMMGFSNRKIPTRKNEK